MNTYKKGTKVIIDFGYKKVEGIIVDDNGGKYVSVKHDNFKSEVFNRDQISFKLSDKEIEAQILKALDYLEKV